MHRYFPLMALVLLASLCWKLSIAQEETITHILAPDFLGEFIYAPMITLVVYVINFLRAVFGGLAGFAGILSRGKRSLDEREDISCGYLLQCLLLQSLESYESDTNHRVKMSTAGRSSSTSMRAPQWLQSMWRQQSSERRQKASRLCQRVQRHCGEPQ